MMKVRADRRGPEIPAPSWPTGPWDLGEASLQLPSSLDPRGLPPPPSRAVSLPPSGMLACSPPTWTLLVPLFTAQLGSRPLSLS